MEPKVTVGIPSWNDREAIDDCLHSIYTSTQYENYSVVVVDNGSSDGSVELINSKYDQVDLIVNEENRGAPKAFNQIIKRALSNESEHVILLNSDIKISQENWLLTFVDIAQTDQVGIVGCKNVFPDGTVDHDGSFVPFEVHACSQIQPLDLGTRYRYNRHTLDNAIHSSECVDVIQGSAFLLTRELIKEVGTFDEAFTPAYFSDYDICIRAWDSGFKVVYTPEVELIHSDEESGLTDIRRLHYYKRNELKFIFTYYPLSWLPIVLVSFFLPPAGLAGFLLQSQAANTQLREELRREPLLILRSMISLFTLTLLDMPRLCSKRRQHKNVKELLK